MASPLSPNYFARSLKKVGEKVKFCPNDTLAIGLIEGNELFESKKDVKESSRSIDMYFESCLKVGDKSCGFEPRR